MIKISFLSRKKRLDFLNTLEMQAIKGGEEGTKQQTVEDSEGPGNGCNDDPIIM